MGERGVFLWLARAILSGYQGNGRQTPARERQASRWNDAAERRY